MSSLSPAEVEHVARLARLELGEDEVALYTQQLGKVLEHFAGMAEVDTTDVPPTVLPAHLAVAGAGAGGLRSDAARPSLERAQALRGAPESQDGYFGVPQVSHDAS